MKHTLPILALFTLHASLFTLPAAVPLRWTVETSRAQVAQFEAYRGETLLLEATMKSYGSPLATPVQPSLYWQTNGMGAAWWTAPATASGNVLRATWSPTNDCGGTVYNCFIGGTGATYRAAFRLRMLPSPGFTPNHIPLPTVKDESDPVFSAWLATNELFSAGVDTNAVNDMITSATNGLATKSDLGGYLPLTGGTLTGNLALGEAYAGSRTLSIASDNGAQGIVLQGGTRNGEGGSVIIGGSSGRGGTFRVEGGGGDGGTMFVGGSPFTGGKLTVQGGGARGGMIEVTEAGASIKKDGKEVATEEQLNAKADAAAVYAKDEADARFYPADEGALWASWWSGDGFRVAVSNYDVAASSAAWDRLPSASFDYRPGGTGALVRVWSETTRWERHRAEAAAFSNAVDMALAGKAGLDWGRTTPTGFDAPEGFTWLDTPAVAVAGGLAWQRTVTSEGAVWLLCSNGMVAESGGATNGSFRVVDMSTGEAAFEVLQGERRTVGANCGEVYTWKAEDGKTHMRVVYNVESDDPPVLHVAEALKTNGGTVWHDEGAEGCPAKFAGWTGSSGAWTNALWRASAPAAGERDALFCFPTYEKGGETVVKNHAPVSMSKIVVGGVTYAIGTATVGGHTVLTLTEAK